LHATARTAGELPRRSFGTPQDGGDFVEGHGEHIVQHESEAFGGFEFIENDKQGEATLR
jgi:hypothetical protein